MRPSEKIEAEDAECAVDEKAYGFWICLMSDAIVFALLFAVLLAMSHDTADGAAGRILFRLPDAVAETMLLLPSSATFGFASVRSQPGDASAHWSG